MEENSHNIVTIDEIKIATDYIKTKGLLRITPTINCNKIMPTLQNYLNSKYQDSNNCKYKSINFKLENMQNQGSYKIRGILNILNRFKNDHESILITISAGNFGRSFAYCCNKLNIKTKILMPDFVPEDRVKLISSLGSEVMLVHKDLLLDELDKQLKLTPKSFFVHPFDDLDIIRGIGSLGLEIYHQNEETEMVIVGVGGGALISGIASCLKSLNKNIEIIGVEPEGGNKMKKSIEHGKPMSIDKGESFVSGLMAPYAGKHTFNHVKLFVSDIVLVKDSSVKEAMKILYDDLKIVAEPSGAACLAALLENKINCRDKNITFVISGGNVSIEQLSSVILSID